MPGFDRTGPQGAGPRTGRGMGYCNSPASVSRYGFGFGRGGGGRGWRNRFFATGIPGWVSPTPEQEIADLDAQANWLREQLDAIQKRIEELTAK
ncbi:MAG: DUF5320 domain-containing protein [Chloroflexota bacterium]